MTLSQVEQYVGSTSIKANWVPEAADYILRAEALGGTFDQSHVSPAYHASYVKQTISDMVAGLKTDGVWSKMLDISLLSCVTYDAIMARLKYNVTAVTSSTGFSSADYLAAGSASGLLSASGKHVTLGTGSAYISSIDDLSIGCYISDKGSTTGDPIGYTSSTTCQFKIQCFGGITQTRFYHGAGLDADIRSIDGTGMIIANRLSTAWEWYRNGTSNNSGTSTSTYDGVAEWRLCTLGSQRVTLGYVGTAISDADAAAISTRVNTLMTAIGANVY